jgi:hypothetical protein
MLAAVVYERRAQMDRWCRDFDDFPKPIKHFGHRMPLDL